MKIPDKVTIMGIPYKVTEVDVVRKNEALWGEIDYQKQEIRLDKELAPQKKEQVFTHEVLHGILEAIGEKELNEDENLVQGISSALYQVLASHPTSFS